MRHQRRTDHQPASPASGYLRCSICERASRSSLARSVTLSVADATTPNVSLSAHTHSATPPEERGRQAALPPSEPGSTRFAPADLPVKLSMKPPSEVPVRLPPMNRM